MGFLERPLGTPLGRDGLLRELAASLEELVSSGRGNSCYLLGPEGIGKTTVLRWLSAEARGRGLRVAEAGALEDLAAPFLLIELLWRELNRSSRARRDGERLADLPTELPAVGLFVEAHPDTLVLALGQLGTASQALLLSREKESRLRARYPELPPSTQCLTLSKGGADDAVAPTELDVLAERLEQHLRGERGRTVALAGLEYLVTQNAYLPVLRMVQFLHEVAQEQQGHLFLSFSPGTFEGRERALLESEGEVLSAPTPARGDRQPSGSERLSPSLRLIEYLTDLEREARAGPLLLVVDDLQWADESSLQALRLLVRASRHLPVVWAMGLRDEQEERPPGDRGSLPWDAVKDLAREELGKLHDLKGIDDNGVVALIERRTGAKVSPRDRIELVGFLQGRTRGNPYFLEEVLHDLSATGVIATRDGHVAFRTEQLLRVEQEQAPVGVSGLRRLLSRRLGALGRDLEAVTLAAALAGQSFETSPLQVAVSVERSELEERLGALERAGVVHLSAGGRGGSFTQPLLREVSLAGPGPDRAGMASRMVDWWVRSRPEEEETIARLLRQSGRSEEAVSWQRKALERAIASVGRPGASRLLGELIRLQEAAGHPPARRVEEVLPLIEAIISHPGSSRGLVPLLQELSTLPTSRSSHLRVLALAVLLQAGSDPARARSTWERLQHELSSEGAPLEGSLRGRLEAALSRLLLREGASLAAVQTGRSALDSLGDAGPPWLRSLTLYTIGWGLRRLDRLDEASEVVAQGSAFALHEGLDDRLPSFDNLVGELAHARGELAGAREAFARAIARSKVQGNLPDAAVDLLNLAGVLTEQGELRSAEEAVEEARWIADRLDLRLRLAVAARREAEIRLQEGKLSVALALCDSSIARYRELGYQLGAADVELVRAEVLLAQGDRAGGEAALGALSRSDRTLGLGQRVCLAILQGRALELAGDPHGARARLSHALETAQAAGGQLKVAQVRLALAQWERSHGDAERARQLKAEIFAEYARLGLALPRDWR